MNDIMHKFGEYNNLGNINYSYGNYQQEYTTLCTLGTSYITRAKHYTSLFWNLKKNQLKKRKGIILTNTSKKNYT
jgi:hypothetical protein